jgi:hypothetical protein
MSRVRSYAWALAIFLIIAFPAAARAGVAPNKVGQIDCNGFSHTQQQLRPTAECADVGIQGGHRFYDNGWYIGHDEPSVRYISNAPGSGADVTYVERLGRDPAQLPTVRDPGNDITHFFELSVAPWFSMDLCDPDSSPMTPCTPVSDANAPSATSPGGGDAFMELQFYPPGFAPFVDSISCDDTHWCSALTIDSLECNVDGSNCNPNCTEPVNFAWIQHDGVPTGPPSPQESDLASVTPNRQTLLMNPGDTIVIHMFDARLRGGSHAFEVTEDDLTNHTSGFMIASAANGFMNTSPIDCSGTPFNFQPEYSTAAPGNIDPWGFGDYNINSEFEIGHFEPCTRVTGPQLFTEESFTDTFYTNCEGPYEAGAEDPSLEPDDSPCYPFGDTHGGTAAPNLVTGCDVFTDAIGDLDYDGTSYRADWPTSSQPGRFPGAIAQAQPTTLGGGYPRIQFVTDMSATEFETGCNTLTGSGCVMPPPGPGHFYPYWTLVRDPELGCTWQFGNAGRTGNSFGGDAQWGTVNPNSDGAFQSQIEPNPGCSPQK